MTTGDRETGRTPAPRKSGAGDGFMTTTLGAMGLATGLALVLGLTALGVVWMYRPLCWTATEWFTIVGVMGWTPILLVVALIGIDAWKMRSKANDDGGTGADAKRKPSTVLSSAVFLALVTVFGNVGLNLFASRLDRFAESRKKDGLEIYVNHDLARLSGECVELAILEHADRLAKGDERSALLKLAKTAPARWEEMIEAGDPLVISLGDTKLTEFILEPRAEALNKDRWAALLTSWRDGKWDTNISQESLDGAAASVARRFGVTLREKLKADFERGGRAAEAMHLDIFGELLRGAETLAKGMDEANATIAEIQKLLADDAKEIPALRAMLVEARASSDAFAQASARSFGLMMESLAAIRVDLAANLALTEAVKEDTGEIREGVDDVSRKIDKQREEMQAGFEETQRIVLGRQGGSVPPPARQVRTNLSTAPNRNSVLTSREAIRAELLAWVTTPGHVRARAIVAAPGVNATDIALDVAHELVQSQAASAMPPRDVWWLTARRVEDDGPVFDPVGPLSRLLRQIGSERLPATEGEDPARVLAWSVKAALSEGPPALFVIDGITDAGLLDDLLPGGSCITLVTTNRTDLPRRLIPVPDSVPALTDDEAFELLTSRRPDLKDARNHPAMLKIIRDSSGIDIVLEQEENYLAKASRPTLDELAADLCGNAKDHPFIQDLPRGATSDARSVACAVNLSLGNLPADGPERSLLNHAAWCAPDAIPLSLLAEAAGLDLGEAEHAADELASRSIVRLARNEAGILISIHSPMQSVLRLQQISDGTLSAVDHLHGILIPLYSDVHNHTSYERRTELWTHCEAVSRIPLDLSLSEHAQLASVNLLAVLAGHLRLIGQLDAANANIEYCINWGRDHEAVPETDLAKWLELRGRIRQFTGDLVGAESDVNDALNYHMKQQEPNPAMVATLHAYRGRIRQLRGSLAEAESDVTYGMDLALSIPEHVRRDVEAWRGWRSHIRSMRGDLPGAIVDIEDCIQWFEVNQADNKRAMNTWLTIRAYVRYRSGDPVAAIKDIDAALAWFESLTPPYPQGEAETKAYRAAILHALGNNEAAYKDIQDAFVWADRSLYTNQWLIANWRHTRSLILSSRGDTTEAVEDITKSIDWCSRGGGSVWVMATLLKDSARILAADDRWALAIDRIEESVQLHESAFGIQHPWTAEVLALQEAIRAVALP